MTVEEDPKGSDDCFSRDCGSAEPVQQTGSSMKATHVAALWSEGRAIAVLPLYWDHWSIADSNAITRYLADSKVPTGGELAMKPVRRLLYKRYRPALTHAITLPLVGQGRCFDGLGRRAGCCFDSQRRL